MRDRRVPHLRRAPQVRGAHLRDERSRVGHGRRAGSERADDKLEWRLDLGAPHVGREELRRGDHRPPVVVDPDGAVSVAYGVARVPESFLVAPDGTVVQRLVGGVTERQLDDLLRQYEAAARRTGP